MKLYGIDLETHDPCLSDRGPSWVYGEGEVLAVGLYNGSAKKKRSLNGDGGAAVRKLLLDKDACLVGANIVYDLGWLCSAKGLRAEDLRCSLVDVSVAESLIDEHQPYGLDDLAWKYLGERKAAGELMSIAAGMGLRGDFRKHLKKLWDAGYKREIREYAASDADQPARIWEKQKEILETTGCLDAAIMNFKLIKISLGMKQRGTRIDMAKRKKNYELIKAAQDELREAFESRYGKVNVNSPKQLAELFDRERVPYRMKIKIKGLAGGPRFEGADLWDRRKLLKSAFNKIRVKKGELVIHEWKRYALGTAEALRGLGYEVACNPNIDKYALAAAKKKHAAARAVGDLKQVSSAIEKFLGPKFDRFIVKHGPDNYRIHADFKVVGARKTGRYSCGNPNLQQIPSRTVLFEKTEREIKLYKLCRETIIPDEGCLIGKADYSGQENRIMAHIAVGEGATEIREAYRKNPDLDYHDYIGELSGLYAEYGPEIGRKYAKNCSFGLGYGMQPPTMAETFNWTVEQAERVSALYHEGAPFVRATMDKASEIIVKRGYVKTLAGRRLRLRSYNGRVNVKEAYKGFNKIVQGSAADMIKAAMVQLDERGLLETFPLCLQVHDELVFAVPKTEEAIRRLPELQSVMENAVKMSVPVRVDPEVGPDWSRAAGRRKSKSSGKRESAARFIERIVKSIA
jgi:DNA polymerase-1